MTTVTPEEIQYWEEHIDDTLVPNIIACCGIAGALTALFIGLRLTSRRVMGQRLHVSDYLILVAWLFANLTYITMGVWTKYGGGRHIIVVKPEDEKMMAIFTMLQEIFYIWGVASIKCSVLALYSSIFPQKAFRYFLWGIAALVVSWALSAMFVSLFQCYPIEYLWDRTIPGGHCLDAGKGSSAIGIINICTDLIILAMPTPLVYRLNLTKQKKILTLFTFAIGGSACIVSIVRLPYTLPLDKDPDPTWSGVPALEVSAFELMTGILAVSTPAYVGLYRRFFDTGGPTQRGHYGAGDNSSKRSKSRKVSRGGISGIASDQTLTSTVTSMAGMPRRDEDGIRVTSDIEMALHVKQNNQWERIYDDDVPMKRFQQGQAH